MSARDIDTNADPRQIPILHITSQCPQIHKPVVSIHSPGLAVEDGVVFVPDQRVGVFRVGVNFFDLVDVGHGEEELAHEWIRAAVVGALVAVRADRAVDVRHDVDMHRSA
jgi:hypothetical protein